MPAQQPIFQNLRPNVQANPRPTYQNNAQAQNPRPANQPRANQRPIRNFTQLGQPLDELFERLREAGRIGTIPPMTYPNGVPNHYDPKAVCAYHSSSPGHATSNCWALRHKVQDMIDSGDILLRRVDQKEPAIHTNPLPAHGPTINMIYFEDSTSGVGECNRVEDVSQQVAVEKERSKADPFILDIYPSNNDPFIIDVPQVEIKTAEPIVIELPEQLPVKDSHQIPWNYQQSSVTINGKSIMEEKVSVVTRSGRVIAEPDPFWVSKGKESTQPPKPPVTEKEAEDFLKMVKRSEYTIVEQLSKMPSQISILNLLLTSEMHREALLKVLNEAHVPKDIGTDKLAGLVGNVLASNQITFSEEEMTAEGRGHNKALYIAVRCNGRHLPRVLIDNGSALNICPWSTLEKLGFSRDKIRPAPMIVRGFDGVKRETMGEVDLVIEMGPSQYQITCQVIHMNGVYNLLLGRPWIHSSGSVPSSLHQMVKFVSGNKLVTIFAEDDHAMLVHAKGKEEAQPPFIVYDVISVGQIQEGKRPIEPQLSDASMMIAKEMVRGGYQVGSGLGKNLQGIKDPICLPTQTETFGLGFRPNAKQRREMKERKIAEKEGRAPPMTFPPLYVTFPRPAEVVIPGDERRAVQDDCVDGLAELFIGMVTNEAPSVVEEFPCIAAGTLQNWVANDLPVRREFR